MSESKPKPATPATSEAAPEASFDWAPSPFEVFLEQHFKKLLLALLAVGVGVGVWLVLRQQAERRAIAQAQAFTGSETLDDYKKVIANHPGTVAAGSAQLMIANLLAQNNDTSGALEELKKFTAAFPQHPMVDQAAFRTAVLLAEKDGAEAGAGHYETFINQFPNSPLRPLAQMRKADALVGAGKRDDALAIYEAIQKDNTIYGNPVLAEAKERASQVRLKPPTEVEFVPEPAAPPAATPGAPAAPGGSVPPALEFEAPAAPEGADAPAVTIDPAAVESPVAPPAVEPAPAPAAGQ